MDDMLKNKLNQEIERKLIKKFSGMMKIRQVKESLIMNAYEDISMLNDSTKKTNKEMISELFKESPFDLMNQLIPYIVCKEIEVNADVFLDTENFREKYEFPFTSSFRASDFNIITYVSSPSLQLFDSDDNDVTDFANFEIELDRFNYLSKEIHFKGKFIQDDSVSHDAFDSLDKSISIFVTGVLKEELIPSWVEYLIEGCINIEYQNNKMALFNIFASLDKFIELLNNDIFDFYIINFNKILNKFTNTPEEKIDVSEFLKGKIRKFGKDNRRIMEKLRDALKEVGINGKNQNFLRMYSLIKEVEEIEEIRNKIGHGEKVIQNINIGEVLYTILTIIFSTIKYDDFEKNAWKKIVT
jgi:hypothetical protein